MNSLGSDGESVSSRSLKDEQLSGDVCDEDSRSEASSQDTDNLDGEVGRLSFSPRPQSMIAMDQVIKDISKSSSRPTSLLSDSTRSGSPSFGIGRLESGPNSTLSSPSSVKSDFIAELKKATPAPNLRKTKKPNEDGQMTCIYSFGGVDSVKPRPKSNTSVTDASDRSRRPVSDIPEHLNLKDDVKQTTTTNGSVKPRPMSVNSITTDQKISSSSSIGDLNPKNFEEQVPQIDKAGNPIPEWRRQMLARQMAEKAKKELEEKKKIEEVEARFRGMPSWKRQLIEKRENEAKLQEKPTAKQDKKSSFNVEVKSLKS